MLYCRYLVKKYASVRQGMKVEGSVSFLSDKGFDKSVIASDFRLDSFVAAFKHRAARCVF